MCGTSGEERDIERGGEENSAGEHVCVIWLLRGPVRGAGGAE